MTGFQEHFLGTAKVYFRRLSGRKYNHNLALFHAV